MKKYILFVLMFFMTFWLYSQEYLVGITLSDVRIIEECHFGDEWSAYFSFGGDYRCKGSGDVFVLRSNQEFGLKSMIFEGNETHSDYEDITTIIAYEDLEEGRYRFEQELYVEDENTGRYSCNNAKFNFSYTITVTER